LEKNQEIVLKIINNQIKIKKVNTDSIIEDIEGYFEQYINKIKETKN